MKKQEIFDTGIVSLLFLVSRYPVKLYHSVWFDPRGGTCPDRRRRRGGGGGSTTRHLSSHTGPDSLTPAPNILRDKEGKRR